MRTVLDTRLMDATAGEPGLLAELRDERRALLFDLGDTLRHLAPRTLLRASHAFVSHTHMDHFSGFDHWLALCLGRVKRLVLWGAGGFEALSPSGSAHQQADPSARAGLKRKHNCGWRSTASSTWG